MSRTEIGAYLQRCRKAMKLTQEDVAAALSVVPKTVSDWEVGKYAPESETLFRLLDLIHGDPRHVYILFIGHPPHVPQETLDISGIVAQAIAEIEAEDRQSFRQALTGWLAGWRAAQRAQRLD